VTFVARTDGDPASVAPALRLAIRRADPDLGLYQAGAARPLLAPGFVMLRIVATLTLALGGLALVLSMGGLYGVLSQFVSQRTREMGLRLALGATAADVARVALRQGARPVVTGLILGLVFGTLIRAGIRAFSIPVDIVDGAALVLIPIPVLIAAAAACYLPARRASRVDPNVALRDL
jgi:ABC-type antimicrobial peptide transport system permease subunit